jgi:hypothetical protein
MQRLVLFVVFGVFISWYLLDTIESKKKPNVEFYSNLIESVPNGDTIGISNF